MREGYFVDDNMEWEDYCYECSGYGDDYYIDDNGDLISSCSECTNNPNNWEDGYFVGDNPFDI